MARIRHLYAVEHAAKGLDAPARAALRQERAAPVLAALKDWLDRERPRAVPKTPIAEAFTYLANQWAALNVYVADGRLAIDNNAAERAVKPFAIGRNYAEFRLMWSRGVIDPSRPLLFNFIRRGSRRLIST